MLPPSALVGAGMQRARRLSLGELFLNLIGFICFLIVADLALAGIWFAIAGLVLALFSGWLVVARRHRALSPGEIAQLLDRALGTQERITTLQEHEVKRDDALSAFIVAQLPTSLGSVSWSAVLPFRPLRLAVVFCGAGVFSLFLSFFLFEPSSVDQTRKALAEALREDLAQEESSLSKQSVERVEAVLSALEDESVSDAELAELSASALNSVSSDELDRASEAIGDSARSAEIEPSPTPTATPTPTPVPSPSPQSSSESSSSQERQANDEKKQKPSDASSQNEGRSGGEKGEQQEQDAKNQQGEKQPGKEQGQQHEEQGEGDGDGAGAGAGESQQEKSGKQGSQSSEGSAENAQAQPSGKEGSGIKETLSKIKEGAEKRSQGEEGSAKSSASGSNKEQGGKGQNQERDDQSSNPAAAPTSGGKEGENSQASPAVSGTGATPAPSRANPQKPEGSGKETEREEPSDGRSQGAQGNRPSQKPAEREGTPSAGLGGEKKFQDVTLDEGSATPDPQFARGAATVIPGLGEVRPKTDLPPLSLAPPTPATEGERLRIPPEYRGVIR